MTILGTRPEVVRLSTIIPKLDSLCDHVLVHTGQNFDYNLNDVFFKELRVRTPDQYLNARGSFGEQMATILPGIEKLLKQERPDRFLVLGDTNSSLAAIMVKRIGIPVFHMEAGNRCYDDRVPEETNRRLIDHSSDVLMPYTERSRSNLLREGIDGRRIFVTGNPIYEVLNAYREQIEQSKIHGELGLATRKYFLVTMHRAENVDVGSRLQSLTRAFSALHVEYGIPVIVSTHPHTRQRLQASGISMQEDGIRYLEPFGFFDFVKLEQNAYCVLSDSGTVQEECSIFGVPSVTIRDTTERPETLEYGSNILSGTETDSVLRSVKVVLAKTGCFATPPEYLRENVSNTVRQLVLGYYFKNAF
ncbi:MAG: UDP-N-acetylglucosamine 2-epimerase (non-hydrolyzing) [Candidatus Korobacteraceae bacterium]|jgi:UDP-N-acetylglucosamine 2-epimerase (non-hydrolysing)